MTVDEAAALLAGAGLEAGGSWIDLGAGTGTFTLAVARALGPTGSVLAIDTDASPLRELERAAAAGGRAGARIEAAVGDVRRLSELGARAQGPFDGAVLANVLHYLPRPGPVLAEVATRITAAGRIVVVEYDRTTANPWVPYPLPPSGLAAAAADAGLTMPTVVGTRPSRYGRTMYCAVLGLD